ncbi:DUF4275 family protein [Sporosarcina sp. ANT_H38]|uniref:DUF4275 family protein n=1 Tax=Sporosarcina sp. ANT_H38 TaxID=2597358 RepID=UPI0011F1743F|nr:DUF4275 family protein [Sporosarcina sp. ANT_H38]KAA0965230.1 DUF4275 family protein [Sporosarcina sp. ANT_H38]
MDLVNRLKDKQVQVREIPGWGPYVRQQWEGNFADHLSHEEKEEIYLYYNGFACGYLWHVFSFEKRDCLKESRADEAFNNAPKNACYVFYQNSDYALIIENATLVTAGDFVKKDDFDEGDIYVVDKDFTWTYVNTHEASCGPYFSRSNENKL